MLKITQMTPEIYHLKFKSSDNLALHLLRFCNYYEHDDSRLYRKKIALSEILEVGFKAGKDWLSSADGINLPISIIYRMAKEEGSALTTEEKFILSLIDTIKSSQPALKYLIGTWGADDDADEVLHELAHGFYYTNTPYKLRMDAIIKALPKRICDEMYRYLKRLRYNPSVYDDEFQAYMATGIEDEEPEVVNQKLLSMFRAKFVDVFLSTISEFDLI